MIPAQVIKNIERYAYKYAVETMNYKVPLYDSHPGVMHLSDLFNMTAGTSTGSILAAGLAMPKKDDPRMPAFFAQELLEIYSTKGDQIF